MGNKGVIKDTKTISFVVSTWSKSIEESRLTKSCAYRLGLLAKVWFCSGNDNFFLCVHYCSGVGVVVPVMKSVISDFRTGCLLFLPLICLDSEPSWIDCCSRFSIFSIFSVVFFLLWAVLAILSSIKASQSDPTSFLVAWYSFQEILSLSKHARDVK